MNILDKIIAHKKEEIIQKKQDFPIQHLEKSDFFERNTYSLKQFLQDKNKTGIIAEFKRKSPSKSAIHLNADVEKITSGYAKAGASGLSILTDQVFFGGSNEDLIKARKINLCPILRKDFIVDEYQIIEAKSIGADVILLIAACLTKKEIQQFTQLAKNLDLEVLVELHDKTEIELLPEEDVLVGVNNRNLKTLQIDIQQSFEMFDLLPKNAIKIAESGITNPKTIIELKKLGFQGFLIGEKFMQNENPEKDFEVFVKEIVLV